MQDNTTTPKLCAASGCNNPVKLYRRAYCSVECRGRGYGDAFGTKPSGTCQGPSCEKTLVFKGRSPTISARKKFCSHVCRARAQAAQLPDEAKTRFQVPKPRVCESCGDHYQPTAGKQRWCVTCVPSDKYRALAMKYGFTKPKYDAMMLDQGGLCAICRTRDALVVDHSHSTGNVRGILCYACNNALGMLLDDHATILRAAAYVSERS